MEQVRELLSKGSAMEQLQNELTVLEKPDRQQLLEKALGKGNAITIPAEDILADLSITWSKLRILV